MSQSVPSIVNKGGGIVLHLCLRRRPTLEAIIRHAGFESAVVRPRFKEQSESPPSWHVLAEEIESVQHYLFEFEDVDRSLSAHCSPEEAETEYIYRLYHHPGRLFNFQQTFAEWLREQIDQEIFGKVDLVVGHDYPQGVPLWVLSQRACIPGVIVLYPFNQRYETGSPLPIKDLPQNPYQFSRFRKGKNFSWLQAGVKASQCFVAWTDQDWQRLKAYDPVFYGDPANAVKLHLLRTMSNWSPEKNLNPPPTIGFAFQEAFIRAMYSGMKLDEEIENVLMPKHGPNWRGLDQGKMASKLLSYSLVFSILSQIGYTAEEIRFDFGLVGDELRSGIRVANLSYLTAKELIALLNVNYFIPKGYLAQLPTEDDLRSLAKREPDFFHRDFHEWIDANGSIKQEQSTVLVKKMRSGKIKPIQASGSYFPWNMALNDVLCRIVIHPLFERKPPRTSRLIVPPKQGPLDPEIWWGHA